MKIFLLTTHSRQVGVRLERKSRNGLARGHAMRALLGMSLFLAVFPSAASAQKTDPETPVVVQPGPPGMPSKTLPSSTRAVLPPLAAADVAFMQGMIMHHAQAVE